MLDIGSRLGPFRIEASIGAGGMGEVYRAQDTRLLREVAIKVLPPAVADDSDVGGGGALLPNTLGASAGHADPRLPACGARGGGRGRSKLR